MTWRQCGTSVHRQPAAATNLVAWLRSILAFTGKGVPSMCDYSLHHVATRPARVGDKLVATRFRSEERRVGKEGGGGGGRGGAGGRWRRGGGRGGWWGWGGGCRGGECGRR